MGLLTLFVLVACEAGFFDVEPPIVASIVLDTTDVDLVSGNSVVIRATPMDPDGNRIEALPRGSVMEWSTSNGAIASISVLSHTTARVRGAAAGTAAITAALETPTLAASPTLAAAPPPGKGARASAAVHVRPANLVYVSGSGQAGPVGATLNEALVVRAVNSDGSGVANVEVEFVATSAGSVDPSKTVTNEEGLATTHWKLGDAPGEQAAEARPHNRYKLAPVSFTATTTLPGDRENSEGDPGSVVVTPRSATLNAIGDEIRLEAVVRDADGNQLPNLSVAWSSRDAGIATVDTAGRVTGVKAGRVTVVATIDALVDSAAIEVSPVPASITVSPATATLLEGASKHFSAMVLDANGVALAESVVHWSSSNESVATIDGDGLAIARGIGTATLTAASDSVSETASIKVEAPAGPPSQAGVIPAFPGAEGWGATALNACRTLRLVVHKVTNTNDGGAGSLRDILENRVSNSAYDVVVFAVGGTIAFASQVLTNSDCVYVAGQTAPGDGIMIRSNGTSQSLLRIVTNNVRGNYVIRYLRLRHGHPTNDQGGGLTASGAGGGHDIIFDHISTSWAGGSGHLGSGRMDSTALASERYTIQNSIVAEGFASRGAMIQDLRDVSIIRNLYATTGNRNPRVRGRGYITDDKTRGVEIVNNLVYNANNRIAEGDQKAVIDWVKNYIDYGPHQKWSASSTARWQSANEAHPGSLYVEGNDIRAPGFEGDDWSFWRTWEYQPLPENFRRSRRLSPPQFPVQERSPAEARQWVLDNAGASRKVTCSGEWVWARDAVDERILTYVRSRSALDTPVSAIGQTAESIHGSWPIYSPGTPCADTDGDGLPDTWEERYFDCSTCADPAERTASGYLLIEHYVNGTDPRS